MLQVFLTFFTAIALSGVAAYYSVIGLAQIFPGSFWPIITMGIVLEISKLVTVSWVYNNWQETSVAMKTYFLAAILLLMTITSMGIFGFLSRAHIESNINVGSNSIQLQVLEQQEKNAKDRLQYLLKRAGNEPEKISRRIDSAIQDVQQELKKINEEKLPLLTEENKLTAEIGPIKYVAELLYEKNDTEFINKAVRLVILVIIVVFDPLAVLLLIAANQTYKNFRTKEKIETTPKTKSKKKKTIRNVSSSLEVFFKEENEVIPKSKITTITSKDVK